MHVISKWVLPFLILAAVVSSCSPGTNASSEGTSQTQNGSGQQPEDEIARQWAEIEEEYPESARVIAQALLYMSTPFPVRDEQFEYISAHQEWKLQIGHCAHGQLFAPRLRDSCMIDLSEIIEPPPELDIELPDGVKCIRECLQKDTPYSECFCECLPEYCF